MKNITPNKRVFLTENQATCNLLKYLCAMCAMYVYNFLFIFKWVFWENLKILLSLEQTLTDKFDG